MGECLESRWLRSPGATLSRKLTMALAPPVEMKGRDPNGVPMALFRPSSASARWATIIGIKATAFFSRVPRPFSAKSGCDAVSEAGPCLGRTSVGVRRRESSEGGFEEVPARGGPDGHRLELKLVAEECRVE
jgi:hypothetical protein